MCLRRGPDDLRRADDVKSGSLSLVFARRYRLIDWSDISKADLPDATRHSQKRSTFR